jgi:nitroreductase
MSVDDIKSLMELTILSPTSYNQQNWRFITVTDQDVKEKISIAARGQAQPKDGSLVIVLCGNTNAWNQDPKRYWRNNTPEKQELVKTNLAKKYTDNPQSRRDEVFRSCGFAAQTIMLTAKAMGYDSNPMIGFDPDKVAEIIKLPENHVISMLIAVGKQTKPAMPRGGQLPLEKIVFTDKFS